MATDTVLNELILQEVTHAEFEQLGKDNLLDENRIYLTPDSSLKGTLLDFKWADHLLNDISWLRGDTFSWQSGDVYVAAYNHLVADFEGTTAETETIGDITITFYRAEDGHKICLPDQEDKVLALYNKTGVAWYYILDTKNKQFKLPRTKFGFTGLRDEVGGYVEPGLPDHAHTLKGLWRYNGNNNNALGDGGDNSTVAKLQDAIMPASENNPIYGNSDTVQPPATQMYLYFYVGCFEKDGLEQTAGITAEKFNEKADVDLSNINASQVAKDTIVGWGIPDYSAGIAISGNTDFICPMHGVVAGELSAASNGYCQIKVNGTVVMQVGSENNQRCRGPFYAQIQKGDVVHLLTGGNAVIPQSNFYPFKGVN